MRVDGLVFEVASGGIDEHGHPVALDSEALVDVPCHTHRHTPVADRSQQVLATGMDTAPALVAKSLRGPMRDEDVRARRDNLPSFTALSATLQVERPITELG